jgi:protein-S-isoprenylcysteine O-methyltransferase Ste14
MDNEDRDTAGVIAPPPFIFVGGLLAGGLLHRIKPVRLLPPVWTKPTGGLLIGLAVTLAFTAVRTMTRAGTNVDPYHPSTAIVSGGPYRFTRNPIYLSFTLFYTGIAAIVNSLTMLLPLPIVVAVLQRGVIEREERYLERKFGDEYVQYKRRVRRWL